MAFPTKWKHTAAIQRWGIQIVLLNETRTSARQTIKIRGFITEYLRINNVHGGVAILIRQDVPYGRLLLRDVAFRDTETVAVQLAGGSFAVQQALEKAIQTRAGRACRRPKFHKHSVELQS